MQLKQYEHKELGHLLMAERITSTVTVLRDGRRTVFIPGDYVTIHPGEEDQQPVVAFLRADQFEPFFQETNRVQILVEQAPPGREQRVIDLDRPNE